MSQRRSISQTSLPVIWGKRLLVEVSFIVAPPTCSRRISPTKQPPADRYARQVPVKATTTPFCNRTNISIPRRRYFTPPAHTHLTITSPTASHHAPIPLLSIPRESLIPHISSMYRPPDARSRPTLPSKVSNPKDDGVTKRS